MAEQRRGYRDRLAIPLDEITTKDNIRITYDENEMVELITSMKQQGLLQPVGVMRNRDKNAKTEWELVFGNRRYAAARKLAWETIDAVEIEVRNPKHKNIINAIENLQRVDVPIMEQGRMFLSMMKDDGYTVAELAAVLGKSIAFVNGAVDVFEHVPKKFRDKVVHVNPGAKRAEKEGLIAQSNAKAILQMAETYSLNKAETASIFEQSEKGLNSSDLRVIAKLLAQGVEIEDALGMASEVVALRYSCIVPQKNIKAIQEETGASITDYLDKILLEDKALGMLNIGRNRGRRLSMRRTDRNEKMTTEDKMTVDAGTGSEENPKESKIWIRKRQPKQQTLELGTEATKGDDGR